MKTSVLDNKPVLKTIFYRVLLAAVLLLSGTVAVSGPEIASAGHTNPPTGIICTEDTTPGSATFTLTTRTGYISLPDGNVVFMWGFSEGNGIFQHPSPNLCVDEGDLVTIVVHNTLPEEISLIFPGQVDVLANGEPSQPVFDGGGQLRSLAPTAPPGGSATYSFVAENPGTYIYESGTEPTRQINMGLFGGLIVRPSMGSNFAYNHSSAQFNPDTEYIIIMSEIDPMLHMAVEQGQPYNMNNYRSRYWLFNGRSFPDTVADNYAEWLPNQPYGSLTHIHPLDTNEFLADGVTPNPAYNPHPALIRYISVGFQSYPHHPHGNHGRIIAKDGHLLRGVADQDLSFEKFTLLIDPGQTWDVLFHWEDVEKWDPNTNPIPVTIPQLQNLVFGTFYSGSPYLGKLDTLPVGTQALNQCGEYWHIAHNHALQQITAWGVVLSGQITFTRIDPPQPNQCQ